MEHSDDLQELFKALAAFQHAIHSIRRTAENPFYKSQYADLAVIWDTIREPLAKHGLSVAQPMMSVNGDTYLVTVLGHTSGQWMSGKLKIVPMKADPQSLGSAITYGRRYSLMGMLGLSQEGEDDDAESAMDRDKPVKQEPIKEPTEIPNKGKLERIWLATCQRAKENLGQAKYYEVLGIHGFAHHSEVPEELREGVLDDLRIAYKEGIKDGGRKP